LKEKKDGEPGATPGRMAAERRAGRPSLHFAKRKAAFGAALLIRIVVVVLDAFDVLRLPALGALHDIELNLLTFLQAAKSVCLNSGEVDEYVFTILAADKTVALGIVEPLYCSCFHVVAVFLLLKYALELAG
jgi:hypothetical protein